MYRHNTEFSNIGGHQFRHKSGFSVLLFLILLSTFHLRRSAANNWQISTSCFYFVEYITLKQLYIFS